MTWYSNDQRTRNQIDYVLVRARWASSVLDCRSYRGADTGSANNSDHVLLRAAVRLRLKVNHSCQRPDRFDVSKLKTAAGAAFRIELRNRFEALRDIVDPDPETEWAALKAAARESALKHLGHTRRRRKDWLTGPTLMLADQAKQARISKAPNYREVRRQASQAIRRDLNARWETFATATEQAAANGDSRKPFKLVKEASCQKPPICESPLD